MDDELGQEGLEDEVSESSKSAGKGGMMKWIIIAAAMTVLAVVVVFIVLPMFSGPIPEGEEPEEEIETMNTEYGVEVNFENITISIPPATGRRIRNFVVRTTFEVPSQGAAAELTKRQSFVRNLIITEIRKYAPMDLLIRQNQDSLMIHVTDAINQFMPDKEMYVRKTLLEFVTQ